MTHPPARQADSATRAALATLVLALVFLTNACDRGGDERPLPARGPSKLIEIRSTEHFNAVAAETVNQLVLFDFFADWCYPCKQLEPILEKIARDPENPIPVYKVDYDRHPSLAEMLEVRGLPFVAFVKNRTVVYTLLGLHPEKTYLDAIKSFTHAGTRS